MGRMVTCSKYSQELEGLEKSPFRGRMGERIFEHVSAKAWDEWTVSEIMIINEHQLNLGNPEHRQFLYQQMEQFFNLPPDES